MSSSPKSRGLTRLLLASCVCHKARMATRMVTRAYDAALRPTGLRATQIAVLAAVGEYEALSISSLAEALEMERTTLTRNLQPLEDGGYVAIGDERRYRSRLVTLTAAGSDKLERALPLWEEAQAALRRRLGNERWPLVQTALDELLRGRD